MGWLQGVPEVDRTRPKYNPAVSKLFKAYVGVQFLLVLVGLVALMVHFVELSWFYRVAFFGVLILSTMICGAMLENKRWVLLAEYIRLALVAVCLNTLYYYAYLDWFMVMLVGSMAGLVLFNLWFTLSWVWSWRGFGRKAELVKGE